jgi:peroxiredoxin (alkyl hydroperoxide reductase subunit C)
MSYVGQEFPDSFVKVVNHSSELINVVDEATREGAKKVLLFWYPKDFTFVCPTELHAFQAALPEFEARNTMVVGASCDSVEVHQAWLRTPKDKGGIEGVTYPILADTTRELANELRILDYNLYDDRMGDNVTYRATYLIDEDGIVFHESVNHMPLGRDVNEYLRLIDAYTHVQEVGEVCPANWKKGDKGVEANVDSIGDYLIGDYLIGDYLKNK